MTATAALAEEGRWQQLENNPSCSVWNDNPQSNITVTWSGACVDGKAQGRGTQVWRSLNEGEWRGPPEIAGYCGRKTITTAAHFEYDRHGLEGYL